MIRRNIELIQKMCEIEKKEEVTKESFKYHVINFFLTKYRLSMCQLKHQCFRYYYILNTSINS